MQECQEIETTMQSFRPGTHCHHFNDGSFAISLLYGKNRNRMGKLKDLANIETDSRYIQKHLT